MTEANETAPPVATQKAGNGLGVAALILGIVAIAAALIPLAGIFLLWVPALVGIGLGIAGVLKKNAPKVLAIIGLALSVIAVPVGIVTFTAGVVGVGTAVSNAAESAIAESQVKEVVYSLTGDGGTANVTYSAWVDGVSTSKSEEVALPWTFTIHPTYTEGEFTINSFSVSATSGSFGSDTPVNLACSITTDGETVAQSSDTANMAMVSCFG